jgi:hypothetical protein
MPDPQRTALTFRYERWRAISSGILETAGGTFLLLIAVRHFEAGALAKALVAGGGSFGLMLGPWLVARVETAGWPVAMAASRMAVLGAIGFVMMALVPVQSVFVVGAVVTMAAGTAAVPLMTQIYQENYPERQRGKLFSRTFMIRIATAAAFSEIAGRVLAADLDYFRLLLIVFAAAFVFAGYCLARLPSRPLVASGGTHPFRALRFVRDDALFRRTLVMWMLMGFANLMILPLRVEYLANPKYGVMWGGQLLTTAQIALLVGVIPNLARLVVSPVWGWLFDRMNFFVLRIVLNVGFALPDRVADYMSVHTFFTGLRGVLAPLVAFQLVAHWSVAAISWLGAGMIVAATLILMREIKSGRNARFAVTLTEDVSE